MSIEQLIYSDLMFGDSREYDDFESENDIEDDSLEEGSICEKDYYRYLDRLEKLNYVVNNINMDELKMIIDKWNPEESVRYLYSIISRLKEVS